MPKGRPEAEMGCGQEGLYARQVSVRSHMMCNQQNAALYLCLCMKLHSVQDSSNCRHGNVVNVADMVTIDEGPHKGKMASVRAIVRGSLFLYSRWVFALLM